jgi:transcriptional regulator with XRE-family HTH domain
MPRPLVDPRFAATLRRLRGERGLSLRALAAAAYVSKSLLSELENGRKGPSKELAIYLDRALQAGGALAELVTEAPTPPEARERILYAVTRPTRLDLPAVEALADVLHAQRRLDDTLDSHILIPAVEPQWAIVSQLARDARGPHAEALYPVVAEWTQFLGWLQAEARHDAEAVRTLTQAAEQADALDSGPLAAQVENFRGYLERQRGNPRGIVRHFLAAYRTPGATLLQRVGDAVQAAHGFALLGDRQTAERLLGEASDLATAANGTAPPGAAYWLSPTFSRMGIGLAYLALGNKTEAEQHLRAGLEGLPADQRDAEWAREYREALEAAVH